MVATCARVTARRDRTRRTGWLVRTERVGGCLLVVGGDDRVDGSEGFGGINAIGVCDAGALTVGDEGVYAENGVAQQNGSAGVAEARSALTLRGIGGDLHELRGEAAVRLHQLGWSPVPGEELTGVEFVEGVLDAVADDLHSLSIAKRSTSPAEGSCA